MRAVALRVRSFFSGPWWATAASVVMVAVPLAVVLTLTAGADRTATAADRYTKAVGGDADVQLLQTGGAPATDAVRALPGVRRVNAVTFVYATGPPGFGVVFAGTVLEPRIHLVRGRLPSPATADEFAATQSFLDDRHLRLGDSMSFTSFSREQVASGDVGGDPAGPRFTGRVVGVLGGASELDDPTPLALFSPPLLEKPVAIVATPMMVYLEPGTPLESFQASLPALGDGNQFLLQSGLAVSTSTRRAVSAQAAGIGVLALVAAVAVIAIVGQFLARQLGRRATERRHLLALGYTGRQTTAEQVGWSAVIVGFGTVLAVAIAVVASPLFPRGFVRLLDPDAGDVVVSPLLLAGAAVVMAVAVLAWVMAAVLLARRAAAVDRPSGTAEALARAGLAPSTVTGVRFALTRGRDSTSVWAACLTLFVATATVLGAVVFASSLSRLVAEPARFGSNFDLLVDSGDEPLPPNALDGVAGVAGASVMATTSASVDGRAVDVVGVEPLRGAVLPRVLQGRFPASADEVALGAVTARQLRAHIGDTVTFTGDSGQPAPFRVVGTAVIPAPNSFGDGGGYGAAMLQAGLVTISPSTSFSKLALQLAPGARAPDTIAGLPVGTTVGMSRPADVVNLARARSIPVALAVVVGVLGAMTLAHALITSVRRRRQDFAVLRALGADRRWIGRTVHVQASTIAVVALIGGIPFGIVAGRIVFRLLVDQLGLVSDPTMPVVLIAVTSVAVLVLANLAAVIPGRRAGRLPIARLLRAE